MESVDVWSDSRRFQNSFIFKWGLPISLIILLLFIALGSVIRIPIYINFPIKLLERNQDYFVGANSSGKINLLVRDSSNCKKNQAIAYIINVTSWEEILYIKKCIKTMEMSNLENTGYSLSPIHSGDIALQNAYTNLQNQFFEFKRLQLLKGEVETEKRLLNRKVVLLDSISRLYIQDAKVKKKLLDMKSDAKKIDERLYDIEVVSRKELKLSDENRLSAESQLNYSENNILTNRLQVLEVKASILEKDHNLEVRLIDLSKEIRMAVNILQGVVNEWEEKFLIKAPAGGTAMFSDRISDGDFVKQGQVLFYISNRPDVQKSSVSQQYIATGMLPKSQFSKMKIGDEGRIEIEGVRVDEDGYLLAKIERYYVPDLEANGKVVIKFEQGLKTSANKQIKFIPGIDGTAFFKAKNETLLERIFKNYIRILNKNP